MEGAETTPVTVSDERLESLGGLLLAERYQLGALRARGALCVVYDAQDVVLRRPLAIKVASQEQASIYREALNATAGLSYPAFLAVYDALEQDEHYFLAQEYIDGQPMSAYMASGVPARRGVALALQMARALAYTHQFDLAHGDLAPTALLIDRNAVAHINNIRLPADWEYFDAVATAAEQSGLASASADTRARLRDDERLRDVWATGAALWTLVTRPRAAEATDDLAGARIYREDVTPELQETLARTLDLAHERRIAEAGELALELEALDLALAREAHQQRDTLPIAIRSFRASREMSGAAQVTDRHYAAGRHAHLLANAPTYPRVEEQPTLDPAATRPSDDVMFAASAPVLQYQSPRDARARRQDGYDPYDRFDGHAAPTTPDAHGQPPRQWPEPNLAMRIGYAGGVSGERIMRPWVWTFIGVALFVAFFLIGYLIFPQFKLF
ncbi:MAG TPA: protein kinase [Ktedonobacterales bacterium]